VSPSRNCLRKKASRYFQPHYCSAGRLYYPDRFGSQKPVAYLIIDEQMITSEKVVPDFLLLRKGKTSFAFAHKIKVLKITLILAGHPWPALLDFLRVHQQMV